jgi:hypothetical protein
VAISDGKCKEYWLAGNCDFLKPNQKRSNVIDKQLEKVGLKWMMSKLSRLHTATWTTPGILGMFPKADTCSKRKNSTKAGWPEKFQGREHLEHSCWRLDGC